tara:strand:- start:25322 stop:26467 length:1146 start_codon:yes stop_codon:yes gene_type:complete
MLPPANKTIWGIGLGISILFGCPIGSSLALQEPLMRVLVDNSPSFRFRADGDLPLLVNFGSKHKRLSALNLKFNNDQILWSINNDFERWNQLPKHRHVSIQSSDPRGIWLGERRYRGELRVSLSDQNLSVVNHLGIERYLMSVVGSEMPKAWPIAALKAQAVAARTYALKRIGKQGRFDINSTESTQVYLGIEAETKSTRKAVNSTRSLVLRHHGELISAVFHSSSGGQTESSGAVWKYQLPYLVGVKDYDQHSPKYKWKLRFEQWELKKSFPEIGGLHSIQVLRRSKTGRILNSKIYGPYGSLNMTGVELRNRLNLKSTLAEFKFSSYSPDKGTFLLVIGQGAGHGVGMSQWGAYGLAKKGANFRQILHHFYRGVDIRAY